MNTRLQTDIVRSLLESRGYAVQSEVPLGRGLWKGIRCDFIVSGIALYPDGLGVECKWQSSVGSADEKLAYTVLNIRECYPIPTIILCSGGELAGAMAWAKGQVGGNLVGVMNTDEFIRWVSGLPQGAPE